LQSIHSHAEKREKKKKEKKNRSEIHSTDEKGGQENFNRKKKLCKGTDESFVQQAGKTTKPGGAQLGVQLSNLSLRHKWTTSV
jgi:hypothetical protein